MLALYAAYRQPVFATWIQILYYTFAAAMLALAFGYFTSAVNVFFKDMANIVGICLQFGIWMTPIMYDEAIFTSRNPWIDLVYNDFYVDAGADVTIVAGCGVHTDGAEDAAHNGIHRFFLENGSRIIYREKHVGTGNGSGLKRIDRSSPCSRM